MSQAPEATPRDGLFDLAGHGSGYRSVFSARYRPRASASTKGAAIRTDCGDRAQTGYWSVFVVSCLVVVGGLSR